MTKNGMDELESLRKENKHLIRIMPHVGATCQYYKSKYSCWAGSSKDALIGRGQCSPTNECGVGKWELCREG